MVVLLHGNYPGYVIECHCADPEVCVVWNLLHFLDETIKIWCRHPVHCCDEVGGRKAILVGRRSTTLRPLLAYTDSKKKKETKFGRRTRALT